VYVVFAYDSFEDMDILCITGLDEEFPTSFLNITFEDVITIFGDPYKMDG